MSPLTSIEHEATEKGKIRGRLSWRRIPRKDVVGSGNSDRKFKSPSRPRDSKVTTEMMRMRDREAGKSEDRLAIEFQMELVRLDDVYTLEPPMTIGRGAHVSVSQSWLWKAASRDFNI